METMLQQQKEGDSRNNPIFIRTNQCPYELEPIRAEWEKREIKHGDDGPCVLGAGFKFKFKELYYKMPPQGQCQGSLSWESSMDIIEQMLIAAGCEELSFDYGNMD